MCYIVAVAHPVSLWNSAAPNEPITEMEEMTTASCRTFSPEDLIEAKVNCLWKLTTNIIYHPNKKLHEAPYILMKYETCWNMNHVAVI